MSSNPFIAPVEQIRSPRRGAPIVFLDFDGVLHGRDVPVPSDWGQIRREAGRSCFLAEPMDRLKTLCEAVDAELVLSTSWRLLAVPLAHYNTLFWDRVIGQTEERPGRHHMREAEVEAYRAAHAPANPFVLLDDKPHHFDALLPRLVLVNPATGLTASDAVRAQEILRRG